MTKFEGDSVSARRKARGYTSKDRTRDLQRFQDTGVHPEVERMRAENAAAATIQALPDPSTMRQYCFLDLAAGGKQLGRLVIELFDDIAPVAVATFRNRCSEGARDGFRGTELHRVVPDQAAWGGRSSRYREAVQVKRYPSLRHIEAGVVGVSLDGAEFVLCLDRALELDERHQVVGRVSKGDEILKQLNAMQRDREDRPAQRITVARCGATNAAGTYEDYGDAGGSSKQETAEEAAERIKQEAEQARDSVKEALEVALGQKRKQPEGGSGSDGLAAKSGAGGSGGSAARRGVLDSMLGDISSDSEDGEEEQAD